MAQNQAAQNTVQDTVTVAATTVACDGDAASGGHPRVFLHLDPETHQVVCPYCSRTFKLDPNAKVSAGH